MRSKEYRPFHRLLAAGAALALLTLSGCVAYPAGYPGYPGYAYAPAPAYIYPPVAFDFSWGWGHGCCWGRWR